MKEYPGTCLRGIPNNNQQFIDDKGNATGYIFRPHDESIPVDSWFYESINWEDSNRVEEETLREKENGKIKFKGGVARVSKSVLDRLSQNGILAGKIYYNREEIPPDRLYHGNICLHEDFRFKDKHTRVWMYGQLATAIIERLMPIDDEEGKERSED